MRRLALIFLFVFSGFVARAQYFPVGENDGKVVRGIKWVMNQMIKPNTDRDTNFLWIAPPELKLQVSNSFKRTGMKINWEFKDNYDQILEDGSVRTIAVPGKVQSRMLGGLTKNIGLSASYNKFGFSMSFELNKKRKWHNKKFSLNYKSGAWSITYSHYNIKDDMKYRITIGDDPSQPYYYDNLYISDLDWSLKYSVVDVFYNLNKRHFAQDAAFGRKTLQRKSAGSAILAARYMQATISFHPDEYLARSLGNIDSYTSYQVAIGAGYSYNLVFWHRNPQHATYRFFNSNARRGLRNITLSMTAIPLFTTYNQIHLEQQSAGVVKNVKSTPKINWTGSVSFGINVDRFSFGTRVTYDSSLFKSYHSTRKPNDYYYNIHWNGSFHNLAFSTYIICRI